MKNTDSSSTIINTSSSDTPKALNIDAIDKSVSTVALNLDSFSKPAVKNVKKIAKRTYVAESPIHGKGLFASKPIKADVTLGRLQGMLTEKDGTYVLWLNKHFGLEVTNDFRFINHDSNPNCALTDTEVVTLREIEEGEEFTHDYGWE